MSDWKTSGDEARLARLLEDDPTLTADDVLDQFPGRKAEALGRKIRRILRPDRTALPPLVVRPSSKPTWDEHLVVKAESALCLFDAHMPYQDGPFITNMLDVASTWGVETVIIGGDLLDVAAYSKWGPDPEDIFEHELADVEDFFASIAPHFERVIWFLGNHEARALGAAFQRQIKSSRFLRMVTDEENVQLSSYEHMTLQPPSMFKSGCGCRRDTQYDWKLVHPVSSSITPGRVPSMMASRRWTTSHVGSGHGHLSGVVPTEDGKRIAWDTGMCGDPLRIQYAQKRAGTRPAMVQGGGIIRGQHVYPMSPGSDFAALKRMYAS